MADEKWVQKLSERYDWPPDGPGPEKVVEEAKTRGIDSIDHLIERMDDSPVNELTVRNEQAVKGMLSEELKNDLSDRFDEETSTGYVRWKWYREYRDSFVGNSAGE